MTIAELSPSEHAHLNTLRLDAQRKQAEAQQLAADAAKLVSATVDRLDQYKDTGFFKRCWYRISGKTADLASANQSDLIEMQHMAWRYLRMLQEQNLIQAHAIAVIRNNLHELAQAEAETRELMLELINKFDQRMRRVEDVSAIIDWRTTVQVKGYDKYSFHLRLLRVAFDYFSILQDRGISYDRVEGRPDLEAALEALDIDYSATLTLSAFVEGLVDEMMEVGYRPYCQLVELRASGRPVDAGYILRNVSGVGYNAIYQIVETYPHIEGLTQQIADETERNALVCKALQSSRSGMDAEYTLIELAREIVAGSLLAYSLYQEEHESAPELSGTLEESTFSIDQLLGSLISISHHHLIDSAPSPRDCETYVDSFALLLASTGNCTEEQRSYLSAVARALSDGKGAERAEALGRSPEKIPVRELMVFLNTPERQFIWLTDAIFIAGLDGLYKDRALAAVEKVGAVLNIKRDDIARFIEHVGIIGSDQEPKVVLAAIENIFKLTPHWKTVLDFRRLSLNGVFRETEEKLVGNMSEDISVYLGISREISEEHMNISGFCMGFGDENFIQRGIIATARMMRVSNLKDLKDKAEKYVDKKRAGMSEARYYLRMFGLEPPEGEVSIYDVRPDEDTALSNDKWVDNMCAALDKLSNYLAEHEALCGDYGDMLRAVASGKRQ